MGYNTWELLRKLMMNTTYGYNKEVKEYFKDIYGDEQPFNASLRHTLLEACLIDMKDSAVVALHKRLIFYCEVLRIQDQQEISSYQENIRVYRRQKPSIVLYFENSPQDIKDLVRGRVSFRIMDDNFDTQTESDAKAIGVKIKNIFGGSTPLQWHKGKELYSYSDWSKGYQLQILANAEAEAKKIVDRVLQLQNHTPQWEFFNHIINDQPSVAFPSTRTKKQVLGDLEETPIHRPIEIVTFKYATICIPPYKPKTLYSTRIYGLRKKPLVDP